MRNQEVGIKNNSCCKFEGVEAIVGKAVELKIRRKGVLLFPKHGGEIQMQVTGINSESNIPFSAPTREGNYILQRTLHINEQMKNIKECSMNAGSNLPLTP